MLDNILSYGLGGFFFAIIQVAIALTAIKLIGEYYVKNQEKIEHGKFPMKWVFIVWIVEVLIALVEKHG